MNRALSLLQQRCDQSAEALMAAEEMDNLLNVYVPACTVLGWSVRRCYWEGRTRGSGVWAAEMLRTCLLVLCGLLGEKVKLSEYARSISVALLSWTSWHDDVPAAAYVEESCEAQLSMLASALKRNPHATGIRDVSDMYALLLPVDERPHAARHHPVSQGLQRALLHNVQEYTRRGPGTVRPVPWRSGSTCVVGSTRRSPRASAAPPWATSDGAVRDVMLHALSRVHRGDRAHAEVVDLCDDFLERTDRVTNEAYMRALARLTDMTAGVRPVGRTRAAVRALTVRDRHDPPPKRRRVATAAHPVRTTSHVPVDAILYPRPSYTGPRLVGIPS